MHFIRKGNIQPGQKVLVNGAGGSIGTIAVQLARIYGAEVTGVDSTVKMDMLRSIGAQHVIDYTQEDFTNSGESYNVIFDSTGKASFSGCLRSLKPNGYYLMGNPRPSQMMRARMVSGRNGKTIIGGAAPYRTEDLIYLKDLIEGGKLKPVIDRSYPLEQAAEAHRYVESGQKKGNVVLTVAHRP